MKKIVLALALVLPWTWTAAYIGQPTATSTFNSVGIYWFTSEGAANNAVSVQFRALGSAQFLPAQSLWFDVETKRCSISGAPCTTDLNCSPETCQAGEYRGSIVGLVPATTYEVKLDIQTSSMGDPSSFEVTTWSENFPISTLQGKVNRYTGTVTGPLIVDESGDANGYALYEPEPGQTATIVSTAPLAVDVRASYVIIRGFNIIGGTDHAIEVTSNDVTNIVIEGNDISGWGSVAANSIFGEPFEGGIRVNDKSGVKKLVIQHNNIHHPATDSNSWCENRSDGSQDIEGTPCFVHPDGPHGMQITGTGGNHVIRHNRIYSDDTRYFGDGIGGQTSGAGGNDSANFDDTDIHDNYIERCWDNPIEVEGADRNARVFRNRTERSYSPIAITPVSAGPVYVFRNVIGATRKGPFTPNFCTITTTQPCTAATEGVDCPGETCGRADNLTGRFLKTGGTSSVSDGAAYIYHNTVLQQMPEGLPPGLQGATLGIDNTASNGNAINLTSRNNIIQAKETTDRVLKGNTAGNDFNKDLYHGRRSCSNSPDFSACSTTTCPGGCPAPPAECQGCPTGSTCTGEPNGICGVPDYDDTNGPDQYYLEDLPNPSPGLNAGETLVNFNEVFGGGTPDMGAFEKSAVPPFPPRCRLKRWINYNCIPACELQVDQCP